MFDRPPLDDDDDDRGPVPAEPPLTHEGMPIHGWHGGDPVSDLDRMGKERWREVLAPLRHATRLAEAARLFAMRPTTLARVLTVRGVDRALHEHQRDR
jgi:hypothetical protein